jgi:hypothetical protein
VTKRHFVGPDDKLTLNAYGYAELKCQYDSRGNKTEMAFFDQNHNPIPIELRNTWKGRCHKAIWTYDDHNKKTDVTYWDAAANEMQAQVVITEVYPETSAQRLHLQGGDVLETYGGKPIRNFASFIAQRAREEVNTVVELVVLRNGERVKVQVEGGTLGIGLTDKIGGQ